MFCALYNNHIYFKNAKPPKKDISHKNEWVNMQDVVEHVSNSFFTVFRMDE